MTSSSIPSASPQSSILAKLLLTRLMAGGKRPAKSALIRDVRPFFSSAFRKSDAAWKDLVSRTLEELHTAEKITHPRTKIEITNAGRQDVCTFLGVSTLPATMPQWGVVKRQYLFPLAVGEKPNGPTEQKNADTTDGLKAAILVQLFDLPVNTYPSFAQALRALMARHGVSVSTLNQGQLCEAFVQKWIADHDADAVVAVRSDAEESSLQLATFADRLHRIVMALRGDSPVEKVLISRVWNEVRKNDGSMLRADFDQQLLAASQQQLIRLSRADLPAGLDPNDRRESEIILTDGEPVHFVRTSH